MYVYIYVIIKMLNPEIYKIIILFFNVRIYKVTTKKIKKKEKNNKNPFSICLFCP